MNRDFFGKRKIIPMSVQMRFNQKVQGSGFKVQGCAGGLPILKGWSISAQGWRVCEPTLGQATNIILNPEGVEFRGLGCNPFRVGESLGSVTQGSSQTRNPGLIYFHPFRMERFHPLGPNTHWNR
jgi:hypothetical protein